MDYEIVIKQIGAGDGEYADERTFKVPPYFIGRVIQSELDRMFVSELTAPPSMTIEIRRP